MKTIIQIEFETSKMVLFTKTEFIGVDATEEIEHSLHDAVKEHFLDYNNTDGNQYNALVENIMGSEAGCEECEDLSDYGEVSLKIKVVKDDK